ncbi:hypothetical protein [Bifidobacterium sp. ESL0790]|uniref:hypothetical protein n=1 Tax=Bifidobacterium sp. ESL0790 TaxID=2983233 RepID=UPI0023F7F00A|nr:hypothetical protein [Bifidobacterium sp. ESL0790]WEV73014.1 hypothetical protein OZY47_03440 [Bifidobacterium sp. ESL0790]
MPDSLGVHIGLWPDGYQEPAPYNRTIPSTPNLKRNHYRLLGWAKTSNATTPDYSAGDTVSLPLDGVAQAKLYAVWGAVPPPTFTAATPKSDGTHIKGTILGGGMAGDLVTITDGTNTATATPTVDATGSWEVILPTPTDLVGNGGANSYTGTLKQADGITSEDSDPYGPVGIDVVAPGLEHIIPSGRTIHGIAYTSGNETTQPNRTTEQGDTITVTWPDNSTTTATSDADGKFTIAIPSSVSLSSTVHLKVADTAGAHGYDGHNNESTTYEVRLTPPVTALPLTGGTPRKLALLLLAAGAALITATARRHLVGVHIN